MKTSRVPVGDGALLAQGVDSEATGHGIFLGGQTVHLSLVRGLTVTAYALVAARQLPMVPPAIQTVSGLGTFLLGVAAAGWVALKAYEIFADRQKPNGALGTRVQALEVSRETRARLPERIAVLEAELQLLGGEPARILAERLARMEVWMEENRRRLDRLELPGLGRR